MSFRPLRLWLGAVAIGMFGLAASPAEAAFTTYAFTKDNDGNVFNPAAASITLYDGADAVTQGGVDNTVVVMKLMVNTSTYTADLFALYFNVTGIAIPPDAGSNPFTFSVLSSTAAGATVTASNVNKDSVDQAGTPSSSINPIGGFDVGVQFGGPGDDGFFSITLQINAAANLSIGNFLAATPTGYLGDTVYFGLRAQNTNTPGGSWKLYSRDTDVIETAPGDPVPAPAGLALLASAAPFTLLLRRLRRQPAVA